MPKAFPPEFRRDVVEASSTFLRATAPIVAQGSGGGGGCATAAEALVLGGCRRDGIAVNRAHVC